MNGKLGVITFLCILNCPYSHFLSLPFTDNGNNIMSIYDSLNANLPDVGDFVAQLLNVTVGEVLNIAKKFVFDNSSSIHEVRILRYRDGGKYENYSLKQDIPSIDPNKDFKVVIHGWTSKGTADWVKNITDSYHTLGIPQTLSVDWRTIAGKNYLQASGCVEHVGYAVADFLWQKILKKNKKNLKNVHLIGHSLGAQVSSFIGKRMQKHSGGEKIYRISALDAAAPLFEYPIHLSSEKRIDESDAEFVDGFHTNAGFLGFSSAFGNHDYYISFGGPVQPGCFSLNIFDAFSCSHGKSHAIFNVTINNDNYLARHCDSSLRMFTNLCGNNILSVVGEQNNATDINGQYFIFVDHNNEPVYPKDNGGGIITNIANGFRSGISAITG